MENAAKKQRPRIFFVSLAELGHATYSERLRGFAEADPRIEAVWLYVKPFSDARYFWEKAGRWLPQHIAYSLLVRRRIKEFLKGQKEFDACFVHTYDRGLFLPRACRQKILIVGLDSTSRLTRQFITIDRLNIVRRVLRWLYRKSTDYLEKRVLTRADLMVSWSKWAAQSLVNDYKVPEKKIVIIPPAISEKDIRYTARQSENGRKLRLLFIGGDFKRKCGEMLVELMSEGLENVCELDIVTKDEVKYSSKSIWVHYGLWHDSPKMAELFAKADIFVLPTSMDMLAIVLIEASAAGMPSIATNMAGIPEIIEDGQSGFLIPSKDKAALKTAIEKFVSDPSLCRTMGANARARFEQYFTAEKRFPELLGAISGLVEQKSTAAA